MAYTVGTPQVNEGTGSATTIATSAAVSASAGDTIVVIATVAQVDLTASLACSDGTNTYSLKFATYDATTTANYCIFVAENVSSGSFTPSVSWGGSTRINRAIFAVPVSGLKAASYQTGAINVQASPGTGTDGVTTGNMTPTEQPACVIGGVANGGSVNTPAAGTGFTSIGTAWQFGYGTDLFRAEHQRITSTSALPLTMTAGANVRHFSVAVILSEAVSAATLSSPTPSGTLGTQTTATIGATTDQTSGTFYAVVDSAANLSGVTATQIKAGQKASGSAALAANSAAVSTTTPSAGVTGLTAGTLYSYAAVQNNSNGDSNVVTGTFTTAAATPTLDQTHFRWRNDDGSETTATWAAAEDANVTIAALTPTRLRVEIAATANPASAAYKLQYRKVGDTYWRDVN